AIGIDLSHREPGVFLFQLIQLRRHPVLPPPLIQPAKAGQSPPLRPSSPFFGRWPTTFHPSRSLRRISQVLPTCIAGSFPDLIAACTDWRATPLIAAASSVLINTSAS